LRVPNGTFVPHPSRERLTLDELTKATIKDMFCKIYEWHVNAVVDRTLEGVKSYYDLHQRVRDSTKLVAGNYKILNFSIDEQNLTAGPSKIENYDTWRKFDFPCVQITGGDDRIFRFKNVPQLNMYGDQIERIYYTVKYPLSEEYRYRVLKDKIQSKARNAILLSGNISRIFTEDDKATFVDVQALPKLTQQDLLDFKKRVEPSARTGIRVSKEEVSYLYVTRDSHGHSCEKFSQLAADKVLGMTFEFPIYWVGSNKRYEFMLRDRLFHLKVLGDRHELVSNYFNFFLDYIAPSILNLEMGDFPRFGVVVLPEDHVLRGMLPELEDALKEGIRFTVANFLNTTFYKVNKLSDDIFFDVLTSHPDLLLSAVSEKNGEEYYDFFTEWFKAGKPKLIDHIKRKSLPFQLLSEDECTLLRKSYYSNQNIRIINVNAMYTYLGNSYFSIFRSYSHYSWAAITDELVAKDLIEYMTYKLACIDKSGN
jgi:hypothetical protein